MKIKDFAQVKTVKPSDVFITDGERGTKTILANDLVFALLTGSPEMHRNVIRGANLGSRITSEQHKAITTGTFEGLWLGDYWLNDNMAWRIVDFNYWNINGALTTPHIVVMPDRPLYRQTMYDNTSGSTNSFWGSKVWQSISNCNDYVVRVFDSNMICFHVDSYQSQMDEGGGFVPPRISSKSIDPRVKYIIPNEIMMYGTRVSATSALTASTRCQVDSYNSSLWVGTSATPISGFATRHILTHIVCVERSLISGAARRLVSPGTVLRTSSTEFDPYSQSANPKPER